MLITVQPNPNWQLSLAQLSPSLLIDLIIWFFCFFVCLIVDYLVLLAFYICCISNALWYLHKTGNEIFLDIVATNVNHPKGDQLQFQPHVQIRHFGPLPCPLFCPFKTNWFFSNSKLNQLVLWLVQIKKVWGNYLLTQPHILIVSNWMNKMN